MLLAVTMANASSLSLGTILRAAAVSSGMTRSLAPDRVGGHTALIVPAAI